MTSLYWVQVVNAVILAGNVVGWGMMVRHERGFLRVIALPPLSWCLHGLLFYLVLFVVRYMAGGVLSPDQANLFNWWSTAIRLHGALACLSLLFFVQDWQRVRNGTG